MSVSSGLFAKKADDGRHSEHGLHLEGERDPFSY